VQTIPGEFETALKRGYAIEGKSRVIAEWNYNHLFQVAVTNPPDDQNWILNKEYFILNSIVSGVRPKSGIFYAITDEARTTGSNTGLEANRYYTIDEISKYKYWICPTPSDVSSTESDVDIITSGLFPVSRGTVELDYENFLNVNKVTATFNLGPMPADFSLWVFEQTANAWVEINNPTIDEITGQVQIWWNGTAWVETQQLDEDVYQKISKVKLEVRSLSEPNKRFQLIEIAARREVELTDRAEGYTINSSMDSQDFIFPVGKMSSNDGAITFNNNDLKMNHETPTSDFYGALVGWCQYRTYVEFDLTPWDGTTYTVRTATMYANDFQQVNQWEYSVELFDIFKILQSVDCPALLVEDQSLARVIATLLDMVGVDTYSFEFNDWDLTNTVRYFWTDGTEKLFDVLSRLCNSFQAALFVDEDGIVRLLTRNDITPVEGEEPVWTFRGDEEGLDLPDIIKMNKKYALQLNKLNIKYTKRQAKVDDLDITSQPLTTAVWEGSDPIVLRAAPLVRNLSENLATPNLGFDDIWMPSNQVATWPFKGKVNIDGELIEYNGKGYIWWDHTSGVPVYHEIGVKNNEERKAYDKRSYDSYKVGGIVGGVSKNPTQQNGYSGRLIASKRDSDGAGRRMKHFVKQSDGWYTMDFWTQKSNSWGFPGKYFTPGGNQYNLANLKNWTTKVNWTECQGRVTVNNSIATINNVTNNSAPDRATHATVLVKDHGDTEFREIGTRLRIRGGTKGRAIIPFYMSNAVGYDNVNPPITEVFNATRCYILNVSTTEYCDSVDRTRNEISFECKNGDQLLKMYSGGLGNAGKIKIDADKWYDIELVYRDGCGDILEGGGFYGARGAIEVYVDGAYTDTWYGGGDRDIRPTSLIGVGAKDTTIVDFEYLYGSTTTSKGRHSYANGLFDAYTLQLPAGTNVEQAIALPVGNDELGSGVLSLATWGSNATISTLNFERYNTSYSINLAGAGLTLKPDQRMVFDLDDIMPDHGSFKIKYTSTNPISICLEYSKARTFPYGIDNEPIPPAESYYDRIKNGYVSSKAEDLSFTPPKYTGMQYLSHNVTTPIFLGYFFDDFGAIIHEVRDFNVDFDTAPAKGVSVYCSNNKARVIDFKHNPAKGIFTMVNVSHRNEIINGTEQIDESNSIDHALILYGHVLEDKGDEVETVTNDLSILRHGPIIQDLEADWIFTKDEAKSLGQWITTHWGDSMDVISMETFISTFIQIGDKVSIYYPGASIGTDWIFIVTDKALDYEGDGLSTTITVRRVR
jgi:hypothetical protein